MGSRFILKIGFDLLDFLFKGIEKSLALYLFFFWNVVSFLLIFLFWIIETGTAKDWQTIFNLCLFLLCWTFLIEFSFWEGAYFFLAGWTNDFTNFLGFVFVISKFNLLFIVTFSLVYLLAFKLLSSLDFSLKSFLTIMHFSFLLSPITSSSILSCNIDR